MHKKYSFISAVKYGAEGSYFVVMLFCAVVFAVVVPSPIFAVDLKSPAKSASLYIADAHTQTDNRVIVLRAYLARYNSPLLGSAETFIESADLHQLDWRLVAAISGVESTFGKQLPYNSHNAWGWGIYGDNIIRFASYEEAIETISRELRNRYIDSWGADNVYKIGRYYAASPTWANRVTYFMEDMQRFELSNPSLTLSPNL